jgi:hypothetical protein
MRSFYRIRTWIVFPSKSWQTPVCLSLCHTHNFQWHKNRLCISLSVCLALFWRSFLFNILKCLRIQSSNRAIHVFHVPFAAVSTRRRISVFSAVASSFFGSRSVLTSLNVQRLGGLTSRLISQLPRALIQFKNNWSNQRR